jgi:hypothetical protein
MSITAERGTAHITGVYAASNSSNILSCRSRRQGKDVRCSLEQPDPYPKDPLRIAFTSNHKTYKLVPLQIKSATSRGFLYSGIDRFNFELHLLNRNNSIKIPNSVSPVVEEFLPRLGAEALCTGLWDSTTREDLWPDSGGYFLKINCNNAYSARGQYRRYSNKLASMDIDFYTRVHTGMGGLGMTWHVQMNMTSDEEEDSQERKAKFEKVLGSGPGEGICHDEVCTWKNLDLGLTRLEFVHYSPIEFPIY